VFRSCLQRKYADRVDDRSSAKQFEVELIFVLAAAFQHEIPEEAQWRLVRDRNAGQHRLERCRVLLLQPFASLRRQFLEEREVARHGTHIEHDQRILGAVKVSFLDAIVKITKPNPKRLTPAQVARHIVAGAKRITTCRQRILGECGQLREVFARGRLVPFIGVDQGIVLIGLERLLAASLAAQYKPAIRNRSWSQPGLGELQNLGGHAIVHLGHHSRDVAGFGAFAQQQRQEAADAVLRASQVLHIALRFHEAYDIQRRLALQHHQIVSGEHSRRNSLLGYQHVMDIAAHHRQQSMKHALAAFHRDHGTAHDLRYFQL